MGRGFGRGWREWSVGFVGVRRRPISFRSVGRNVSMRIGGRKVRRTLSVSATVRARIRNSLVT